MGSRYSKKTYKSRTLESEEQVVGAVVIFARVRFDMF